MTARARRPAKRAEVEAVAFELFVKFDGFTREQAREGWALLTDEGWETWMAVARRAIALGATPPRAKKER